MRGLKMDSNYLVVLIIYSVTVMILHEVADRRYNKLVDAGVMTYSVAGRFTLGTSLLLFPALVGAAYLGLVMAHLETVTEAGFIVALLIFSTSLAAGGFLTFTALRSAEEDYKEEELTMENTEQKKYRLLEDTQAWARGRAVYRIQAVRDFGNVSKGDLGGYIACEDNLSHSGNCWVYDEAAVIDNAQVLDNARVSNSAQVLKEAVVSENACVVGNAVVTDQAVVTGYADVSRDAIVRGAANVRDYSTVSEFAVVGRNAKIQDDAMVLGHAKVIGNAVLYNNAVVDGKAKVGNKALIGSRNEVFVMHPIGSEQGVLTAYLTEGDEVMCTRGCFRGSLDQFSQAVTETHEDINPSVFEEYQLAIKLVEKKFSKFK
ncbi:hypothetical protein LD13_gp038 [Bacillus phage Bobb]|uniref:UDP-3-O-[3-hydroxymyristoyl] glucosamine N-acyltransferase n=1 Tax=Bacillus phage Bobb TaxID=1527469 RepID=A0A076G7L7_9CAUD|nr:hypothetical protein LD13_gp038 [Bacillus phage Bobb]AII27939.1 hypothetical protein [Bacillus phage Bobb]